MHMPRKRLAAYASIVRQPWIKKNVTSIPQLLETKRTWKPYQAQIVWRRFLMFEYARNLHSMRWTEISTIRAPGPGTIFFFKKLCPEAFAFLTRMHRRAAMGDSEESDEASSDAEADVSNRKVSKTVVDSAKQGEKALASNIVDCLLIHQDKMLLHCKTNQLFTQKDVDWNDWQFVICEVRGFVYKPYPRRACAGFLLELKSAHFQWHLSSALPFCWKATLATVAEEGLPTASKRARH